MPVYARLKAAVAAAGLDFKLRLGAEIRLHPDSVIGLIETPKPLPRSITDAVLGTDKSGKA